MSTNNFIIIDIRRDVPIEHIYLQDNPNEIENLPDDDYSRYISDLLYCVTNRTIAELAKSIQIATSDNLKSNANNTSIYYHLPVSDHDTFTCVAIKTINDQEVLLTPRNFTRFWEQLMYHIIYGDVGRTYGIMSHEAFLIGRNMINRGENNLIISYYHF